MIAIALSAGVAHAADNRTIDWSTSPKQTYVFKPQAAPPPVETDPYADAVRNATVERVNQRREELEARAHLLGQAAACKVVDLDMAANAIAIRANNLVTDPDNFAPDRPPIISGDFADLMRRLVYAEARKYSGGREEFHERPEVVIALRQYVWMSGRTLQQIHADQLNVSMDMSRKTANAYFVLVRKTKVLHLQQPNTLGGKIGQQAFRFLDP
jgi:hypothetical protein